MISILNDALASSLENITHSKVKEAMNYSLQAGGKRIRPILLMLTCKACGISIEKSIKPAVALEMVHTYSLIHDDLPAMDNDDLRRGKNTCHVEYNEATAILAGDGLLTEAFHQIAISSLSDWQKVKCIQILADCAGSNGMIYGQIKDIDAENRSDISLEELIDIHHNKTGKLFSAAFQMGCVVGDKIEYLDELKQLGLILGIAFQIQDDILDVTKNSFELGKSNSDLVNEKTTYVSLLGLDKAKEKMEEAYLQVNKILDSLPIHAFGIEECIKEMIVRQK